MAGQNLGIVGASPNKPNTNDGIRSIILSFFNEHTDTTMADIRSLRGIYSDKWVYFVFFMQINIQNYLMCLLFFPAARRLDISLSLFGATARLLDVELRAIKKMDLITSLWHAIMPLEMLEDALYI